VGVRKFHRGDVRIIPLDSFVFVAACGGTMTAPFALAGQKHPRDAHPMGHHMTQILAPSRRSSSRAANALVLVSALAGALLLAPIALVSAASAQTLGYTPTEPGAVAPDYMGTAPEDEDGVLPERLRRVTVNLDTREAPGTVIIDTRNTALYFVLGGGRAIRYGVGVGRQGFTWSGAETISRKAEWPDWYPPSEMIARQPYLPRFMAGGPGNPLGARAMYLGSSEYRIHGTNDPTTIGKFVSSGCIRLTNEDVTDLFNRVNVGTKVVVLPKNAPLRTPVTAGVVPAQPRPVAMTLLSGREAMNLSSASIY
jgi:lipoprotein-anchoring transpeptidase ErfK/SrfK